MDPRHAILLVVKDEGAEGVTGKTLLQKKLYFAALLTEEDFGFRPHYYGPYSREVADASVSLVSNGFLEEKIDVFPGEATAFGEWRRHSYKLSTDGEQVLESISEDPEAVAWRDALRKINEHSFADDFKLLSVAAKVASIVHEAGLATTEEINQKAREYGWDLSSDEVRLVREFLEYLGLVERR